MSELALQLIEENKAKQARGEDASYLDLGNCSLKTLPDLSNLHWLETLVLSKWWWSSEKRTLVNSQNKGEQNDFKTIDDQLLPASLTKIILSYISSLNDWHFLEKLTNLQTLYLSNNKIDDGRFLEKLTILQTLDLRNNNISDGRFLEKLTNLQTLYMSNNNISDGRFLEKLTNLQTLYMSDNNISDGRFEKLTNLKTLYLSNNSIKDGCLFEKLTNLQTLDLRDNSISDGRFLEKLANLKQINLSKNKIKNLTSLVPFFQATELELLWEVPNEITYSGIIISDNPLPPPPPEISRLGNTAILRYFEDLEKEGSDQIYEAKLLLIGEGGAGKTSLCRKLLKPTAALPQEKDRTRGIDIHPLYFDLPEKPGKKFRLNIWDFAGQGKYQSAHSFFYTHRSLYILVDDTRTLNENDAYRALYNNWLQTTELFGGQSPVLVLHNEKDDCARTGFNLGIWQERFSFVHGDLFRINLGGGDISKLTKIKNRIYELATELPHIGDTVPKTWVKVREAIEKEKEKSPYISVEHYRELCGAQGISDSERQLNLSRYFHDIGVFLHFQDNALLRRDVFLQNQWVTDAVYKIFDDAQISGEQRGRFQKSDLARLWHESTYRERHDELLALMLQFELCYKVQDSDTYICPQLLPGDIPRYEISEDIPLQLKYEYVFMPKNLLYCLMVRLHRHIAKQQTAVWNSGMVLERTGAQADIIESLDRRTISVRATGLRACLKIFFCQSEHTV